MLLNIAVRICLILFYTFNFPCLKFIGVAHEDLKTFLENNLPTGKKKSKVALGISDAKLGASIQESCNIFCEYGPAVSEILRGVRYHFHKLIQGELQ